MTDIEGNIYFFFDDSENENTNDELHDEDLTKILNVGGVNIHLMIILFNCQKIIIMIHFIVLVIFVVLIVLKVLIWIIQIIVYLQNENHY